MRGEVGIHRSGQGNPGHVQHQRVRVPVASTRTGLALPKKDHRKDALVLGEGGAQFVLVLRGVERGVELLDDGFNVAPEDPSGVVDRRDHGVDLCLRVALISGNESAAASRVLERDETHLDRLGRDARARALSVLFPTFTRTGGAAGRQDQGARSGAKNESSG